MPPTRKDFDALQRVTESKELPLAMDLLKVAQVKATALTGHPGWDDYLSRLQSMLNEAQAELRTWTQNCCNAVGSDDMRYAQRQVQNYRAQVELLMTVMQLPGEILSSKTKQDN